ncbi:GNAT family N-acetyltransferase [uncultured Clostridium sp.]|uniref:GNAT family N-acetyltransferase n=1 Tax=uncultured Clostridium sp. TaxID=59620 RepID=UPI00261AD110|nr:GNAT family N-acetyltransferase [uncultured Clostridium sp.]
MIKGYLDLDNTEKERVKRFIFRKITTRKSIEDLDNIFKKKINDYGRGSFIYFSNGKVIGTAQVVLESCKELKTTYIYKIDVCEGYLNKALAVKDLIATGIRISKEYGAQEVYLCLSTGLLGIFDILGYKYDYYATSMVLDEFVQGEINLELIPLVEENKEIYLSTINSAFCDMPHGMYHSRADVEEYLNNEKDENYYFLVKKNNNFIGFINIEIDACKGTFDIGLIKGYRGAGFGKEILETAISFIKSRGIDKIEIVVIKKNKIAYHMYEKRGFIEKDILGYWTSVNLRKIKIFEDIIKRKKGTLCSK